MKRLDRKAPTLDRPGEPVCVRAYGGHVQKYGTSTIDAVRRDPRIAARLHELLDK